VCRMDCPVLKLSFPVTILDLAISRHLTSIFGTCRKKTCFDSSRPPLGRGGGVFFSGKSLILNSLASTGDCMAGPVKRTHVAVLVSQFFRRLTPDGFRFASVLSMTRSNRVSPLRLESRNEPRRPGLNNQHSLAERTS